MYVRGRCDRCHRCEFESEDDCEAKADKARKKRSCTYTFETTSSKTGRQEEAKPCTVIEANDVDGVKKLHETWQQFQTMLQNIFTDPKLSLSKEMLTCVFEVVGVDAQWVFAAAVNANNVPLLRDIMALNCLPELDFHGLNCKDSRGEKYSLVELAVVRHLPADILTYIAKRADVCGSALLAACRSGDVSVLQAVCSNAHHNTLVTFRPQLLLETLNNTKSSINSNTADDMMKFLLTVGGCEVFPAVGDSPFVLAAALGRSDLLAMMLPHMRGADVNTRAASGNPRTAIFAAVQGENKDNKDNNDNNLATVEWLLEHKANPNLRDSPVYSYQTAFWSAIERGDVPIIRCLQRAGGKLGDEPLWFDAWRAAVSHNRVEVMEAIIGCGVGVGVSTWSQGKYTFVFKLAVETRAHNVVAWLFTSATGRLDQAGKTESLHSALRLGPEAMIRVLVVDAGAQMAHGEFTQSHWLVQRGLTQMVARWRRALITLSCPTPLPVIIVDEYLDCVDEARDVITLPVSVPIPHPCPFPSTSLSSSSSSSRYVSAGGVSVSVYEYR